MFNQKFMIFATIFGSKVRCVKPVLITVDLDGEEKSAEVCSVGEVFTVTGIQYAAEGLSVFLLPDGCDRDFERVETLDVLQRHFELLDRSENPELKLVYSSY